MNPANALRVRRALAQLRRPHAERAELGRQLCDLLIGDSQWIGGAAENGWYLKLNDFFAAEGIKMDDFAPATVYAYSTWPKGTPNYWALPAMGDANGWFYRKDWFARPEIQAAFKEKYGRDLAEPKTQKELLEIAQFFQGREIDGKTVYGASIFTERGSEGITMGATGALYAWGFKYENTPGKYDMEGASTARLRSKPLNSTRNSTRPARPPAMTTPTWNSRSTPSNPARWRWR
jgi:multiple sugar transport system substrate-binding protein